MRSVRLSPELEKRLKQAAEAAGEPVSAFIRKAVEERCEATLSKLSTAELLKEFIGSVNGRPTDSSRYRDILTEVLVEKHYGKRRRRKSA